MIGLLTLQAAKAAGCSSIIAVDLDEGRLALAARLGADATLGARDDVAARVAALTGGRGVDVAFEVVGAAEPIATAVAQPAEGRHAGADRQPHAEGRGGRCRRS